MASIKKEKNGLYSVQISLGINPTTGKKANTRKRGFTTQKEAKLVAAEIERQVASGEYWKQALRESMTYEAVYEKWLKQYTLNRAESTILKTKRLFKNHFLPKFGDIDISEITTIQLHEYSVELVTKFVRGDTMFNYAVQPILFAFQNDLIDVNPIEKVVKPRSRRKSNKYDNFYEDWQLKLFLKVAKDLAGVNYKQYAFYLTLAMTGMRRQEILAITAADISWKDKTLFINKVVTRGENGVFIADRTKTFSSTRVISLDNETLDVLRNWIQIQKDKHENFDDNWLIFGGEHGNIDGQKIMSINTIRKWRIKIQDLMDAEHGAPIHRINTHGFRHTHITLLAQADISFKAIQERVGHSDASTTLNVYLHATQTSKRELADSLQNLLKNIDDNKNE